MHCFASSTIAACIAIARCVRLHNCLNQMYQNFTIENGRLRLRLAINYHNQFSLQVWPLFVQQLYLNYLSQIYKNLLMYQTKNIASISYFILCQWRRVNLSSVSQTSKRGEGWKLWQLSIQAYIVQNSYANIGWKWIKKRNMRGSKCKQRKNMLAGTN